MKFRVSQGNILTHIFKKIISSFLSLLLPNILKKTLAKIIYRGFARNQENKEKLIGFQKLNACKNQIKDRIFFVRKKIEKIELELKNNENPKSLKKS